MDSQKEIIREFTWSAEAEAGLSIALDGCADQYRQEVNQGAAQLYRIGGESWAVLRIEQQAGNRILVLCLYQGKNAVEYCRYLMKCAASQGVEYMRVHSKRRGIGRCLIDLLGFQIAEKRKDETVYIKVL